jgi:hypothetical protein
MSTEATARRRRSRRSILEVVRGEIVWRAVLVLAAAVVLAMLQSAGLFDRVLSLLR